MSLENLTHWCALINYHRKPNIITDIQKITTISRRRASYPARKGLVCCCPIA